MGATLVCHGRQQAGRCARRALAHAPPACLPSPTLSPTDPVPRGLLTLCPWASSGPQGLYTAYIQPIYSLYAAYMQAICSLQHARKMMGATLVCHGRRQAGRCARKALAHAPPGCLRPLASNLGDGQRHGGRRIWLAPGPASKLSRPRAAAGVLPSALAHYSSRTRLVTSSSMPPPSRLLCTPCKLLLTRCHTCKKE